MADNGTAVQTLPTQTNPPNPSVDLDSEFGAPVQSANQDSDNLDSEFGSPVQQNSVVKHDTDQPSFMDRVSQNMAAVGGSQFAPVAQMTPENEQAQGDILRGAAKGVGRSLLNLEDASETIASLGLNHLIKNPKAEDLKKKVRDYLDSKNEGETAGGVFESIAEQMIPLDKIVNVVGDSEKIAGASGEAATLAEKLQNSSEIAGFLEKHPIIKRIVEHGLKSSAVGALSGAMAGGPKGAAEGAVTGAALASGISTASEGVKALKALRGVKIPVGKTESTLERQPTGTGTVGPSATETGTQQQVAAQRVRDTQGKAVQAAKDIARPDGFTMELGPHTDFGRKMSDLAKEVGDESEHGVESLKDPEMDRVSSLINELNPEKTQSLSNQRIDKIRDQLNKTISQQKQAVKAGNANGTALKYYNEIKSAFDGEMYGQIERPEMYRTPETTAAAQNLQGTSKQYAQTVQRQSKGPAKRLFKADTPEKIIKAVNTSSLDGTTMKEFITDKTPEEIQSLRDGSLKDLVGKYSSHGQIDYEKAWNQFDKQRDSGRILYGDKFDGIYNQLRENAAGQNFKKIVDKNTTQGKRDWTGILKQFEQQDNGKVMYGSEYEPIKNDLTAKANAQEKAEKIEKNKTILKNALIGGAASATGAGGIYEIWKRLSQ